MNQTEISLVSFAGGMLVGAFPFWFWRFTVQTFVNPQTTSQSSPKIRRVFWIIIVLIKLVIIGLGFYYAASIARMNLPFFIGGTLLAAPVMVFWLVRGGKWATASDNQE